MHTAIAEDPVYFPDANLKAAVESHLGISDPTRKGWICWYHKKGDIRIWRVESENKEKAKHGQSRSRNRPGRFVAQLSYSLFIPPGYHLDQTHLACFNH